MMEFDLQRFGGGGGGDTTTVQKRDIPKQTENEKELENAYLQYSRMGMGASYGALAKAMEMAGQTFNPDWGDLYDAYATSNKDTADEVKRYYGAAMGNLDAATNAYGRDMSRYLDEYRNSMAQNTGKWNDLVNGVLPSAYAENRQKALDADLRGTVGSAVNSLGNRGIMNSSVTNKALGDISQNASDTLYKNYLNDLTTEAGLLGQQEGRYKNIYDTSAGNAGSILGSQQSLYDSLARGIDSWSDKKFTANQNNFTGAQTAQAASYSPVSQWLGYASTLASPAQSMYNQMYSGRMGTGTVTTTQSGGGGDNGIWPVVGSLGAAAIGK